MAHTPAQPRHQSKARKGVYCSYCGRLGGLALSLLLLAVAAPTVAKETRPSLGQITRMMLTTAQQDFDSDDAFGAATAWHRHRLLDSPNRKASHFACADYGGGKQAMKKLEELLSKTALRRISNDKDHGTCFFATASCSQAAAVSQDLEAYGLTSFGPVSSPLKLAPGLLHHRGVELEGEGEQLQQQRLTTTHGNRLRFENIVGLEVLLSPGVLPTHDNNAGAFISDLIEGLMSTSTDLHGSNFWSDPSLLDGDITGLLAGPASAVRRREWTRAAAVVHELSTAAGSTPGDVCSWGDLKVHHAGSDVLMIKGESRVRTYCCAAGALPDRKRQNVVETQFLTNYLVLCTILSIFVFKVPVYTRYRFRVEPTVELCFLQ